MNPSFELKPKYGALGILIKLLTFFAGLSLLAGCYLLITGIIDFRYFGPTPPAEYVGTPFCWAKIGKGNPLEYSFLLPVTISLISGFITMCFAQALRVFIDIEYNQRIANELLLRGLKSDVDTSSIGSEYADTEKSYSNWLLMFGAGIGSIATLNFAWWLINSGGYDNAIMVIGCGLVAGLCFYGIYTNRQNAEA